jgi:phospholipid-transporting ATPase
MIGTFAFVLILTMLKEALEDYNRYKSDKELNNRKSSILNRATGDFEMCLWRDIKTGDIVRVNKDEEIPADMLLIAAPKEVVFVSTMNLDGETNLKDKEIALKNVKNDKLAQFKGSMLCNEPNPSIDSWECNLMPSSDG